MNTGMGTMWARAHEDYQPYRFPVIASHLASYLGRFPRFRFEGLVGRGGSHLAE